MPRENPVRLFVRAPLPSTSAAAGISSSPALPGAAGTPARGGLMLTPGTGARPLPSGGRLGGEPRPLEEPEGEPSFAAGGGRALSDAEVEALLPRLTRQDYYTEPSMAEVRALNYVRGNSSEQRRARGGHGRPPQ